MRSISSFFYVFLILVSSEALARGRQFQMQSVHLVFREPATIEVPIKLNGAPVEGKIVGTTIMHLNHIPDESRFDTETDMKSYIVKKYCSEVFVKPSPAFFSAHGARLTIDLGIGNPKKVSTANVLYNVHSPSDVIVDRREVEEVACD